MSARRSVVSGLGGGSGWPSWAGIALIALRSRGPWVTDVPLLAPGAGWSLWSRVTLLTLRSGRTDWADVAPLASEPWRSLGSGLAPLAPGPWRTLGARSARRSHWASRPGLALQIGQLPGQPAHSGFDRIQALRRRRLAGSAWFGGARPLGLACRCSSLGRSLAWNSCHSSLLRKRGCGGRMLRLAHQLRASETQQPSGDHHPHRAVGFARHDPATGIAAPQDELPGSAPQPGRTLPLIGGQSQGGKIEAAHQHSARDLRTLRRSALGAPFPRCSIPHSAFGWPSSLPAFQPASMAEVRRRPGPPLRWLSLRRIAPLDPPLPPGPVPRTRTPGSLEVRPRAFWHRSSS